MLSSFAAVKTALKSIANVLSLKYYKDVIVAVCFVIRTRIRVLINNGVGNCIHIIGN